MKDLLFPFMLAPLFVIPAPLFVIPAKAGILAATKIPDSSARSPKQGFGLAGFGNDGMMDGVA